MPGHGWETMIVDDDGRPVPCGKVGELIVRGPGVMKGYYNNPGATSAALKDGWLYTGDMCKQDEDGFIYLVDRKKDVVISGGENIFPVEIEDFLQAHEDIKDVAVIGMPDKRLGEVPVAIVEPKAGRQLDGGPGAGVLRVPAAVQAPAPRVLRQGAPQCHRQDRETQAAGALLRRRRPPHLRLGRLSPNGMRRT